MFSYLLNVFIHKCISNTAVIYLRWAHKCMWMQMMPYCWLRDWIIAANCTMQWAVWKNVGAHLGKRSDWWHIMQAWWKPQASRWIYGKEIGSLFTKQEKVDGYENDSRKIVGGIWSVTRNEYLLKYMLMDECMMCFCPLFSYLEVRVGYLRRDIEGGWMQ